ncbi:very short patch repair endonuclease [Undibacterium aquatile]
MQTKSGAMADVHSKAARSKNMRAIKAKNTQPELLIRQALYARGFRYRLHDKGLPGTPDIVLKKYKALIFINGCFWHGHRCHLSKIPQTRTAFWLAKISDNIARDQRHQTQLLASEWRYAVIWECALKGKTRLRADYLIDCVEDWIINSNSKSLEISGASVK